MNERIFAITLYAAVVSLSGCMWTNERIALQYNQQQGVSQIPGASQISVNVQVVDHRQHKAVGKKDFNWEGEHGLVTPIEDVTITVRNAIEQELRSRGFQLGSDAALVQIAADLTRFFTYPKFGWVDITSIAYLDMHVTVKSKKGDLLYSRNVAAQGIEPNIQIVTGDKIRRAVNRALENGMKSLFEDQEFLSALTDKSGALKQTSETTSQKLRNLESLRKGGVITEDEFIKKKQQLLDKL